MITPGQTVRHELAMRRLTVAAADRVTPGFVRVTLAGDDLASFRSLGPADHVKAFFPGPDGIIRTPTVGPDGIRQRPEGVVTRDYTPRRHTADRLEIDFAVHGGEGPATAWALRAEPGDELVVGGPRGSHLPPTGMTRVVLGSDASALPALARWIELLPADVEILALVELEDEADRAYLEPELVERARVHWVPATTKGPTGIETAVRSLAFDEDTFVWLAGEAGGLVPVRRYLRRQLGLPKEQVVVDGYWRIGVVALDHHAPLDPFDPMD
ncbi:siderophore-interacting protein [Herbiconiux sp. SYSU D00978]|uniref:siderophore-interacting protein n=1 Tax=Herbiconiux sp. SYSU D00978 TaxID=2812562 RepID=UPI001A9568A9|nr:siderophore-interacting protein [Herbiconiux sp. SYSU D00978]